MHIIEILFIIRSLICDFCRLNFVLFRFEERTSLYCIVWVMGKRKRERSGKYTLHYMFMFVFRYTNNIFRVCIILQFEVCCVVHNAERIISNDTIVFLVSSNDTIEA